MGGSIVKVYAKPITHQATDNQSSAMRFLIPHSLNIKA